MEHYYEYVGILRCRTWHTWPAPQVFEQREIYFYDGKVAHAARITVLSYAQKLSPAVYSDDETKKGPLLWDGRTRGLHRIRDEVLKAPEDVIPLTFEHRHAYRGEVDLSINFRIDAPITPGIIEAVRAVVFSTMSVINFQLKEHLVPVLPFQVSRVLPMGQRQTESTVTMSVWNRAELQEQDIFLALKEFAQVVNRSAGERMLVALELYAAHFAETQARVRFLLLVIGMEAIAEPTPKHEVALTLLDKWQEEVRQQLGCHLPGTDAYNSLEALGRELTYRRVDSIRSQVRNLFRDMGNSEEESKALQKRALFVYDKRSTLVHDGHLPSDELAKLEAEARTLLEMVFKKMIVGSSAAAE